jgi:hypothetical protein
MLGTVFERFVEKSPISVMVRATLERVLGADRLDLWYERTAEKQYTRELLFSTVYDLMSQVVFCVQPSVRAAYLAHAAGELCKWPSVGGKDVMAEFANTTAFLFLLLVPMPELIDSQEAFEFFYTIKQIQTP